MTYAAAMPPVASRFLPPGEPVAARWLLRGDQPPLENVEIRREGNRVVAIRPIKSGVAAPVAVLPALVNAHTHLDLSHHREPIPTDGGLPDWLPRVIASRSATPEQSIAVGLDVCKRSGVGLVADVQSSQSGAAAADRPTRRDQVERLPFLEVLGVDSARWPPLLARCETAAQNGCGLSPHAPYSVPLELLQRVVETAREAPVMMHLAEHPAERTLLDHGTGPFASMLDRLGVDASPMLGRYTHADLFEVLLRARRPLVVHGNHLTRGEIDRLAGHRNASVVWCPQTHRAFRQPRHPVRELLDAGVRVVIGTDSLASSASLDPLADLRIVLQSRPDITLSEALAMITSSAADALGRPDAGRLAIGSDWPAIAVPLAAPDETEWPFALFGKSLGCEPQ